MSKVHFSDIVTAHKNNVPPETLRALAALLTEQMAEDINVPVLAKEWVDAEGNVHFHVWTDFKAS